MTKKEVEKLDKIISTLDGATGRLIVASMNDQVVKEAMEMVIQASFDQKA